MIFVEENGRTIPKEDKIFGINNRAKAMIKEKGRDKVVNGTIGALLDDDGELMILSSVSEVFKNLEPKDFAEYAPISGTLEFRKAIIKDAFGKYEPKSFVEAVATPGGTGAIRNTISNFTKLADKILVADWHWAPYKTIANELGRDIETFRLFNEARKFDLASFEFKVRELVNKQDKLVIILNTPAHNPTGYALTLEDWAGVKEIFKSLEGDKHVVLLADVAYIDFAGDEEESREFLKVLDEMSENVLPVIAHSLSKAYTLYGLRCGAMICLAKSAAVAEEFKNACEYSSRGSWSNSPRAPQVMLSKIYGDDVLLGKVDEERKALRDMLLKRGKAFEEAALKCGLEMVPFNGGFFASIPCERAEAVCSKLEAEGIFLVPLAKGIRVSIASVSEDLCKILPERILAAMK